ncbi:hypothetical protein pb186bvf_002410 [Paramecium bursaria]
MLLKINIHYQSKQEITQFANNTSMILISKYHVPQMDLN